MKDIKKLIINKYLWSLYILATALAIVTIFYEWFIGIALTAVLIIIIILSLRAEDRLRRRTEQYVSTLSYRVKRSVRKHYWKCQWALFYIVKIGKLNGQIRI